ncbi:MAG: orotidine-5'-phosphate decarboxylase [Clostridia bacterium]|nr:orotidine-5'-phosphate decarboxylase [Clostridia bacterium]
MIIDKLYEAAVQNSAVCIGLDTILKYLPDCIAKSGLSDCDKLFAFNKEIIDKTYDIVACYKVQIACYESLGVVGLAAYRSTLEYARSKGCVVIADVKRGDIFSTQEQYAKAHLSGDFEADIVTLNAYMGEDTIIPFEKYLGDKGLFALVKTSNPSGKDFQDLELISGEPLYIAVGRKVSEWGERSLGSCGFSNIGAVVGCTYPKEFAALKKVMPRTFFLVPGYGAQGGSAADLAEIFGDGVCGVVNSSRQILCAYKGKGDDDFAAYSRAETLKMAADLKSVIGK